MYIITKKSTTANKGRRLSLSVSFPGRMLRMHEVANVSMYRVEFVRTYAHNLLNTYAIFNKSAENLLNTVFN